MTARQDRAAFSDGRELGDRQRNGFCTAERRALTEKVRLIRAQGTGDLCDSVVGVAEKVLQPCWWGQQDQIAPLPMHLSHSR